MLDWIAVTGLLLLALARVVAAEPVSKLATAEPDPGWQPRVTAAVAAGVQTATEESVLAQYDAPTGTGGFVDAELGARFGQLGVVAFGRWSRYYDPRIRVDYPAATPDYSARVDDLYVGARMHYWPSRWFRMSFAVGEVVQRERDRDVVAPMQCEVSSDGTLRAHQLFWQTQFAVPFVQVQRWQLEIGVDLASAPPYGFEAALGLGIRM